MSLRPIRTVTLVFNDKCVLLSPAEVTNDSVGQKARGLASLPAEWTLPFFVLSSSLFAAHRREPAAGRTQLIRHWSALITEVATQELSLDSTADVIIRSSAVSESLNDRGRFYSTAGTLGEVHLPLKSCLSKLAGDSDLCAEEIYLIVQVHAKPVSGKGHLSNERQCYEEARDWFGEFEGQGRHPIEPFTINLRNWRANGTPSVPQALKCNLKALVPQILRSVAWWGYRNAERLHFEWVWTGQQIYIVQADEAGRLQGVNPTKNPAFGRSEVQSKQLSVLVPISESHAAKYNKVRNVYVYLKLKLPSTNLYVLDSPTVLQALIDNSPPPALIEDLRLLTKQSLVIRTDIDTDDQQKRQLLPRTNEVRNVDSAIEFLEGTIKTLRAGGITNDVAFIFHNFIPAMSSAFAYAAPGQRKVWIESLWGLPEGLYYNSHDKIEVDTLSRDVTRIDATDLSKFVISKKARFKRYFVAPDKDGNWIIKNVAEPWDWRLSVQKDEWIRQIAMDSRRIAELEQKSVSVMWFIGVPESLSPVPVFPWYHEQVDAAHIGRIHTTRRKTPFDTSEVIRTREDIQKLEAEVAKEKSSVRQVRIQPQQEALLRDKELLRTIGELAKKIDAVIVLEGSTLSHAYYQLLQTQAIVEVVHPFEGIEEKREFNKLVRDHIPDRIMRGGETVRVSKLTDELLLRALREKLVEESFEALDAASKDFILEELADVEEVIEGILRQLRTRRPELLTKQRVKRTKVGGFDEGYVLVDTNNPALGQTANAGDSLNLPFSESQDTTGATLVPIRAHLPITTKWVDQREHGSITERLLNLVVSLTSDHWSAESPDISLGEGQPVLRATIVGDRVGPNLKLAISIYIPPTQLKLLE